MSEEWVSPWPAHVRRFVEQWPRFTHVSRSGRRWSNFDTTRHFEIFGNVYRAAQLGPYSKIVIVGTATCHRGLVHARRMGALHEAEYMGTHCGTHLPFGRFATMRPALAWRFDLAITCPRCALAVDAMLLTHGIEYVRKGVERPKIFAHFDSVPMDLRDSP